MGQAIEKVPSWLMITVFVMILAVLGYFTDLLTFIVGALVMIGIFANGYDRDNLHDH